MVGCPPTQRPGLVDIDRQRRTMAFANKRITSREALWIARDRAWMRPLENPAKRVPKVQGAVRLAAPPKLSGKRTEMA